MAEAILPESQDEQRRTYQNRILLERFWQSVACRDASTRLAILRAYARTELDADPFTPHSTRRLRRHYQKRRRAGFMRAIVACWLCERKAKHRHHILPLENGGRNIKTNIVPLCVKCHHSVHAAPRTTEQAV
jgi:5-methylcytosine-specific restriction endonuclease McrA